MKFSKYLQNEGLVSESQHGFTRGRSCLTNLLKTFEAWTRLLGEGFGLDVIYLDYRKAFDTVPQEINMEIKQRRHRG